MKKIILYSLIGSILLFVVLMVMYRLNLTRFHNQNIQEFMKAVSTNAPCREIFKNNSKPIKYNFDVLMNKKVIEIRTKRVFLVKDLIKNKNLFLSFWIAFQGCEQDLKNIQEFYDNYNDKIQFLIIGNGSAIDAEEFVAKTKLKLPIYVFDNDNFPVGINTFPTSQLFLKNKIIFTYADVGFYNTKNFFDFVDKKL